MEPEVAAAGIAKKRTFKKFSFRGVDLDALLDMSTDDLVKHFSSRVRRRLASLNQVIKLLSLWFCETDVFCYLLKVL